MRLLSLIAALVIAAGTTACATSQPTSVVVEPLRVDQLQELSAKGLSDDALIALIEQQGVSFVLSKNDLEAQRKAGVSEGVLRYLQGRAAGEQTLKTRILAGRYPVGSYFGVTYLGYPYLGYYDGLHYYGSRGFYGGLGGNGRVHLGGHLGGHFGGHFGGHRGGGHH